MKKKRSNNNNNRLRINKALSDYHTNINQSFRIVFRGWTAGPGFINHFLNNDSNTNAAKLYIHNLTIC